MNLSVAGCLHGWPGRHRLRPALVRHASRAAAALAATAIAVMLSSGAFGTAHAAPAEAIEVTVEVVGVRSERGRLLAALHEERSSFPSRWERAVASASQPASPGTAAIPLRLPRPGRYALIVVHDEDGDGRMTKNLLGLPREGYATGRNAPSLELPLFEPARLDWSAGSRIQIRLLYP